jgi:hypothetical protein
LDTLAMVMLYEELREVVFYGQDVDRWGEKTDEKK